jgi:hypothetical protein
MTAQISPADVAQFTTKLTQFVGTLSDTERHMLKSLMISDQLSDAALDQVVGGAGASWWNVSWLQNIFNQSSITHNSGANLLGEYGNGIIHNVGANFRG